MGQERSIDEKLREIEADYKEWCKSFLSTHVDYKSDMPYDIDFVCGVLWRKIEESFRHLLEYADSYTRWYKIEEGFGRLPDYFL